jgi:hypothetical protein
LAAIPAEVRAFALEVATVPDEERPGAIGELYKTRSSGPSPS